MLKKIIISPPFGNWISLKQATSVKGSYTLKKRSGLIFQTLKTLRPIKGGWVNRIGLRNPGIGSIENYKEDRLYSVVGFNDQEWQMIYAFMPDYTMVEVNLGCPNTETTYSISPEILKGYVKKFSLTVVKISPVKEAKMMIEKSIEAGVKVIHLSNTIPTDRGGESGKRLKPLSLSLIKWCKENYPEIKIIGGGGIYTVDDIKEYHQAGANHYSLSTVFFTPWKIIPLIQEINVIDK